MYGNGMHFDTLTHSANGHLVPVWGMTDTCVCLTTVVVTTIKMLTEHMRMCCAPTTTSNTWTPNVFLPAMHADAKGLRNYCDATHNSAPARETRFTDKFNVTNNKCGRSYDVSTHQYDHRGHHHSDLLAGGQMAVATPNPVFQ